VEFLSLRFEWSHFHHYDQKVGTPNYLMFKGFHVEETVSHAQEKEDNFTQFHNDPFHIEKFSLHPILTA